MEEAIAVIGIATCYSIFIGIFALGLTYIITQFNNE
jgi:hypothetical protein